jgi:hypothetical protein
MSFEPANVRCSRGVDQTKDADETLYNGMTEKQAIVAIGSNAIPFQDWIFGQRD